MLRKRLEDVGTVKREWVQDAFYCHFGIHMVGVAGFEPTASTSRTWRANRTALHPDISHKNNENWAIFSLLAKDS